MWEVVITEWGLMGIPEVQCSTQQGGDSCYTFDQQWKQWDAGTGSQNSAPGAV